MLSLYEQKFEIISMDATALTDTDAQIYFEQETKNTLRQTGELELHYVSYLLYTLKKENGAWKIVDQEQDHIVQFTE